MSLSSDLISQFAKITKDSTQTKKETIVYGKAIKDGDTTYVQIDGSDMWTPVQTTATIKAEDPDSAERVTVMIKDHTATILGNTSSPAARTDDVEANGKKIDEFDIIVSYKLTSDELVSINATIENLKAVTAKYENMSAVTAKIESLESTFATLDHVNANDVTAITAEIESIKAMFGDFTDISTEDLEAVNADIQDLQAHTANFTYVSAEVLRAQKAAIESLEVNKLSVDEADIKYVSAGEIDAVKMEVDDLYASHGEFVELTAEAFKAVDADIEDLSANKLSADEAKIKYASIDFSNIGKAAMEYFYAQSGLIKDVVVGDATITGHLVGVTISGSLIEGETIVADKLVIMGEDGLYYKLNTDGVKAEFEQNDYNSINGKIITAQSITASKIAVDDLVAFDATIGGFNITDESIHSGVKSTIDSPIQGIYMGKDGQMALGDSDNFIKYYKETDSTEVIAEADLSAGDSITFDPITEWVVTTSLMLEYIVFRFADGTHWNSALSPDELGGVAKYIKAECKDGVCTFYYYDDEAMTSVWYVNAVEGWNKPLVGVGPDGDDIHIKVEETKHLYKLAISAGSILLNSKSVEDLINDVDTRVTKAETTIAQNAKAIELRVTETEVTKYINNIEVGGRNLLLNSSFEENADGWDGAENIADITETVTGTGVVALNDFHPASNDVGVKLRSKNLLDFTTAKPYSTGTIEFLENGLTYTGNWYITFYVSGLEIGEIYKFSCDYETTSPATSAIWRFRYTDGTISSTSYLRQSKKVEKEVERIYFYPEMTATVYTSTLTNIQLEKGTTAYTPHKKSFEDVAVNVYGKNLLSSAIGDLENWTLDTDSSTANSLYFNCDEIPAGQYTFSCNVVVPDDGYCGYFYLQKSTDGGATYTTVTYIVQSRIQILPCTFTVAEGEIYRFWWWGNNAIFDNYSNFQIELGSTATEYEPYIEPVTYTANADGTVEGVTAISPNMTIMADSSVNVSATYMAARGFAEKYGRQCALIHQSELQTTKYVYQDVLTKLEPNTEYTLSGWTLTENIVKGSTDFCIMFYVDGHYDLDGISTWFGYGSKNFTVNESTGTWEHLSWTFKTDDKINSATVCHVFIYPRDFTGDVYFCDLKLEKGNKATDWTPAPEDVAEDIGAVGAAANDINSRLLQAEATIKVLSEAIAQMVRKNGDSSVMIQEEDSATWYFDVGNIEENAAANAEAIGALQDETNENKSELEKLKDQVAGYEERFTVSVYEDEPCIILHETDSDRVQIITNTRRIFARKVETTNTETGEVKVNYVDLKVSDYETLRSKKAEFEESVKVGGWVWQTRNNGKNFGLVWKGVDG